MDKEIYIIRHGQTDYNLQGIVQGRGINSSLNATGQSQGDKFYEKYGNIGIDKIYVSNLQRTHQTVKRFINDEIPTIKTPLIDEINWGIYEGVAHDPKSHDEYRYIIDQWTAGDLSLKIQGGESAADLQARLEPFIETIKTDLSRKILVCTHGRTLRALLCLLSGESVANMETFPHSNTTLYKVDFRSGTFIIIDSDNTSHLHG